MASQDEHEAPAKQPSLSHSPKITVRGILMGKQRYRSEEEERKETWWELFYDLIFVAVCIRLGELIINDLSLGGFAQSICLYSNYYSLWSMFSNYFGIVSKGSKSLHFIGWFCHAIFVYGSLVFLDISGETEKWDIERSGKGFAINSLLARLCFLPFMFHAALTAHAKTPDLFNCFAPPVAKLVSCIIWGVSIGFADDQSIEWAWGVAILLELCAIYGNLITDGGVETSAEYGFDRIKAFILIVFGEGIIQLTVFSKDDTVYSSYNLTLLYSMFGLTMVYGLSYFVILGRLEGLMEESKVFQVIWAIFHLPLSFSILLHGHAIEALGIFISSVLKFEEHEKKMQEQIEEVMEKVEMPQCAADTPGLVKLKHFAGVHYTGCKLEEAEEGAKESEGEEGSEAETEAPAAEAGEGTDAEAAAPDAENSQRRLLEEHEVAEAPAEEHEHKDGHEHAPEGGVEAVSAEEHAKEEFEEHMQRLQLQHLDAQLEGWFYSIERAVGEHCAAEQFGMSRLDCICEGETLKEMDADVEKLCGQLEKARGYVDLQYSVLLVSMYIIIFLVFVHGLILEGPKVLQRPHFLVAIVVASVVTGMFGYHGPQLDPLDKDSFELHNLIQCAILVLTSAALGIRVRFVHKEVKEEEEEKEKEGGELAVQI